MTLKYDNLIVQTEEKYDPIEIKSSMETNSISIHHIFSKRPYMNQVMLLL